jgi:hypothetical protein
MSVFFAVLESWNGKGGGKAQVVVGARTTAKDLDASLDECFFAVLK